MKPALLTLPGGRPARTPGERQYAQALVRHGAARSQLGQTVEQERAAFRAFIKSVQDLGPVDSTVEETAQAWRDARAAKVRAAKEVDGADEYLDRARAVWAAESASAYAAPEARHAW